jgi:hypothetical protein
METLVGGEEWLYFQEQQEQHGDCIGIAYQQLFPTVQSHLQTQFRDSTDLFNAVSYSCHFPFFATNWPFYLEMNHDPSSFSSSSPSSSSTGTITPTPTMTMTASSGVVDEDDESSSLLLPRQMSMGDDTPLPPPSTTTTNPSSSSSSRKTLTWPKVYVDGWFSVPPNRHGCVDIKGVDRTIAISPFPGNQIGMDQAFESHDLISPSINAETCLPMEEYLRIATQATSRKELTFVYEQGFQNAEQWCMEESQRQRQAAKEEAMLQRKNYQLLN